MLFPIHVYFPALGGGLLLPQAMSCDVKAHGIGVLVGRDLLRHFVIVYDGHMGRVTMMA